MGNGCGATAPLPDESVSDKYQIPEHAHILHHFRQMLLVDLHPEKGIEGYLYYNGVFSREEFLHSQTLQGRKDKVSYLLDILLKTSEKGYAVFLDSLIESEQQNVYNVLTRETDSQNTGEIITLRNISKLWCHYHEREEIQRKLIDVVHEGKQVALSGMNGNGKSQLCKWYAHYFMRQQKLSYIVWWIDGSSGKQMESQLCTLAEKLGVLKETELSEMLDKIEQLTKAKNIPSVLIIDNYKTMSSEEINVIITALQSWRILLNTTANIKFIIDLKIPNLTSEEAEGFQQEMIQDTTLKKANMENLFRALCYSPLGLTSAFLYMDESKIGPDNYLQLLQNSLLTAIEEEDKIVLQAAGYSSCFLSVIRLNIEKLASRKPKCLLILKMMSLLAMDQLLPVNLITNTYKVIPGIDEEIDITNLTEILREFDTNYLFSASKGLDDQRQVSFYKIIQIVVKYLMKSDRDQYVLYLLHEMVGILPFAVSLESCDNHTRALMPHVKALLRNADKVETLRLRDRLARIQLCSFLSYDIQELHLALRDVGFLSDSYTIKPDQFICWRRGVIKREWELLHSNKENYQLPKTIHEMYLDLVRWGFALLINVITRYYAEECVIWITYHQAVNILQYDTSDELRRGIALLQTCVDRCQCIRDKCLTKDCLLELELRSKAYLSQYCPDIAKTGKAARRFILGISVKPQRLL